MSVIFRRAAIDLTISTQPDEISSTVSVSVIKHSRTHQSLISKFVLGETPVVGEYLYS